MCRDPLAGPIQ